MKKSLIAMAALAATSAFAQSSVTLYGIVEAGVDVGFNARTQTVTQYRNSAGTDITAGIDAQTGSAGTPFVVGNAAVANGVTVGLFRPLVLATAVPGANGFFAPVFGTNTRSQYKPGFRVQDGNSQGTGTSRVGFRGTEDLGGGMKANFVLEMGIRVDDGCSTSANLTAATAGAPPAASALTFCQSSGDSGANLFGRNAWGGVSGGFGEVRIGRQVLGSFSVQGNSWAAGASNGLYDSAVLAVPSMGGVRFSDALTYISPAFGGFRAQLMLSAPEITPATSAAAAQGGAFTFSDITYTNSAGVATRIDNKKKTGVDLALNYANGPIYVGFGYNTRDGGYGQQFNNGIAGVGNVTINTEGGAVRAYTLGGSYDLGVVKPFINYTRQTTNANVMQNTNVAGVNVAQGLASDAVAKAWAIGLRAPVGPVTLIAGYAYGRTNTNAAGINTVNAVNNVGYTINTESKVKAFQFGAQYPLSKRTLIQANYGQVTTDAVGVQSFNGATAATNGSSTATTAAKISSFNVGMKHSF